MFHPISPIPGHSKFSKCSLLMLGEDEDPSLGEKHSLRSSKSMTLTWARLPFIHRQEVNRTSEESERIPKLTNKQDWQDARVLNPSLLMCVCGGGISNPPTPQSKIFKDKFSRNCVQILQHIYDF